MTETRQPNFGSYLSTSVSEYLKTADLSQEQLQQHGDNIRHAMAQLQALERVCIDRSKAAIRRGRAR